MIRNKIPEYIFLEHLTKIFHGTLYSMGAKDTEFLTEYVEKNLLSKIVASLEEFSNKGYKVSQISIHILKNNKNLALNKFSAKERKIKNNF